VIENLCAHFGFTRTPFGRELAPGQLCRYPAHQEAVARISWTINERGLGIITGEVGAGKTVAVRAATAPLDRSRHTIIYLGNPAIGAAGIYAEIVRGLGEHPRIGKAQLVHQTGELLAAEEHEKGRLTILIVDEAHLLGVDQLEELRLLTNADMDSHAPFAAILIGQPTLRRMIKLGRFAALDQRITMRCTLTGMDLQQTTTYITHHLHLAGRDDTMFSTDAIGLLHEPSRGLPRAINNLALHALTAAYAADKAIVDATCARTAIAEVNQE